MKKLLLTLVFSVFYVSSASAEMGLNVGVSGQAGIFTASATEFTGSTAKGNGSEHGEAAWGSVFVEGTMYLQLLKQKLLKLLNQILVQVVLKTQHKQPQPTKSK